MSYREMQDKVRDTGTYEELIETVKKVLPEGYYDFTVRVFDGGIVVKGECFQTNVRAIAEADRPIAAFSKAVYELRDAIDQHNAENRVG